MSQIKAILFGLNYENDPENKLLGCINDVKLIKNCLNKHLNVPKENITLCHDNTEIKPTSENIKNLIKENINEINNNDKLTTLWIHYSGHGYYVLDENDDEDKQNDVISGTGKYGYDEVLCPLDDDFITDDELNEIFSKLNQNKKLICVFDCCHSGTALDLPYKYNLEENKMIKDNKKNNKIKCDAILLSGSMDIQKAQSGYQFTDKFKYTGAFTSALLDCFQSKTILNIKTILQHVNKLLKSKNKKQKPQITSSKMLNGNTLVIDSIYRKVILKKIELYEKYIYICKKYYLRYHENIYKKYMNYYISKKEQLLLI